MRRIILQIVSGILGLWLANTIISRVDITTCKTMLLAGLVLGLINFFVKPILKFLTTPLRIITFGLFGLVINMAIIWLVAYFFQEISIKGIAPLFWTAILLWGMSTILHLVFPKKKK